MYIIVGVDTAGYDRINYMESVTVVESVMSLELLVLCIESKTKQIQTQNDGML